MHVDVGQDYARRRRESWRQDQTEGGEAGLDFGHRIIAAINSAPVSQVKTREKLAAAQPSLSFEAQGAPWPVRGHDWCLSPLITNETGSKAVLRRFKCVPLALIFGMHECTHFF